MIFSPAAIADLVRIRAYIAQFNPIAARRMAERLIAAGDSLARFPNRGRPAGRYRELVVVRPYVLVYRVTDDLVEILRVWHGAQDRGA